MRDLGEGEKKIEETPTESNAGCRSCGRGLNSERERPTTNNMLVTYMFGHKAKSRYHLLCETGCVFESTTGQLSVSNSHLSQHFWE